MFVFSSDLGSMDNTRSFFDPLMQFLVPGISEEELQIIQRVIRKSAHVFEYAVLSALWCFALDARGRVAPGTLDPLSPRAEVSSRTRARDRRVSPVFLALLISVVYAGLDELHQAFVSSRTGSVSDVGIDSIGAGLGLLFLKGVKACQMSSEAKIKIKYFGWWFAWGGFSTIMVLIVGLGGALVFWQMLLLPLIVGFVTGIGGVVYYVWRS